MQIAPRRQHVRRANDITSRGRSDVTAIQCMHDRIQLRIARQEILDASQVLTCVIGCCRCLGYGRDQILALAG